MSFSCFRKATSTKRVCGKRCNVGLANNCFRRSGFRRLFTMRTNELPFSVLQNLLLLPTFTNSSRTTWLETLKTLIRIKKLIRSNFNEFPQRTILKRRSDHPCLASISTRCCFVSFTLLLLFTMRTHRSSFFLCSESISNKPFHRITFEKS